MKLTKPILAVTGLGLLAFWWIRRASAAGNLVFYPGTVTNLEFQGSSPVLTFTVNVQNTSSADLLLNSLSGNITSNGYLVGNVKRFGDPVPILGNSETTIPVQVALQAIGITNDLIRAFQYGNFQQKVEMAGAANVNGVQVPVNLAYTIG